MYSTGGVIRVVLFFLHHGFIPLSFPGKVLMRQHPKRITNHFGDGLPRDSVINQGLVETHILMSLYFILYYEIIRISYLCNSLYKKLFIV